MEVMPPGTPSSFPTDSIQQEPPMHLHRPSSDRAQDVSHILTNLFEDLYTRDVMTKDAVDNLTSSGEGSSSFHARCMKELSEVQEKHKNMLDEYNMLERHIIQARARAVSADERAMKHITNSLSDTDREKLGLPSGDSHFRWCLDEILLKKHKLIIPGDLFAQTRSLLGRPRKNLVPHFTLPTISSSFHFLKQSTDDGYNDRSEEMRTPSPNLDEDKSITTLSSDSADRISVPPLQKIKSVETELKQRDRWRDCMKVEDRIEDRKYVTRMEERHNFLKNPRYLPSDDPKALRLLTKFTDKEVVLKAGRCVVQDVSPLEDIQVFQSFPSVVMFTDWVVGRVYETVLDLRNISAVSRMMKVLPPRTPSFSLALGKYPGGDSLVAPGMCSRFNVRFLPDSLADYEDEIQILSQVGSPLVVKIKAQRQPPILTISDKIHCGSCLVGGVKLIELPITNLGGSGRFCILKRSMWPAANFKTVVNPGCLDLGAFQFRPSVFEILPGRSITLELLFSPEETKKYCEDLVIVCNNCQVVHFSVLGEGERAGIELVSVSDGGEENHSMGAIADLTSNHLVTFPPLNPHSFYMRQIIIHNSAKVELPYSWHILKPNLVGAEGQLTSDEDVNWETLEFCPEENPCFFIEPMQGTLQPDGIHEFVLTFAPDQLGVYRNVLHLVLSDVPDNKQDAKNQLMLGKTPPNVDVVEKMKQESRDSLKSKLSRSGSMTQSVSEPPTLKKVISMEIEITGECIPYSLMLHPRAVVVTGNILIGTTVRRSVQMANYSLSPVQFTWSSETTPNIVEVKPPMGVIGPGEIADLEVTVTGLCYGPLECDLFCQLQHQDNPLKLSVVACIDGPTVEIDNLSLDFGLFRLGNHPTEELFIRNTTQLNAEWMLHVDEEESSNFSITPTCGELKSLEQQAIKVTYKPTSCGTLKTAFFINVVDGHGSSVAVHAEVQTPQVCFENCMMVLKDVYLSVPKSSTATLINQTSFPTAFSFQTIRGNPDCDVMVLNPDGVLAPREEREIEIIFTSNTSGEVADVYLPCKIEGMQHPIVLGFYADVQILSVQFSTPDYHESNLKVIFDDPIPVGETSKSKIVVTNLTAIRTPWSATVEHFKTSKSLPKPPSYDFKSVKTRRALLGRTPNLADPLAKTPSKNKADLETSILSDGRGVAFSLNPCRGFLEPFQSEEVTVVAYNNMWGAYQDNISINVEGFQSQIIPVKLNVTGCPLVFQMSRDKNKSAVVRFGSHLEGGAKVVRNLRINNPCCCDIRLDWRNYNYPEAADKKLIDVNMWFGEPFPLYKSSDPPKHNKQLKKEKSSGSIDKSNAPPLVNVRVDPHTGVRSRIPFRMEPDQVIVPAHGHVTVKSIFEPLLLNASDDDGRKYSSYALGFMSLDEEKLKHKPDQLSRLDGFSISPLRLELTSYVRAGKVQIEVPDDEDMTSFHLPLSKLLVNGKLLPSVKNEQVITLINPNEAVLNFSIFVKPPFYLAVDKSPIMYKLSQITLSAQSNIKVRVGFCLDGDVVKTLAALSSGRTLDDVSIKKDDAFGNESLFYSSNMQVRYLNGITQLHPLQATIACPSFKTSVDNLIFKPSFVGQEVHHLVTIYNRSGADTRWKARVQDVSDSRIGQFRVEPCEGTLEAFSSHAAETKLTVAIFYLAKDRGSCSGSIIFEGSLSEPIRTIHVQADGSFDGRYELK